MLELCHPSSSVSNKLQFSIDPPKQLTYGTGPKGSVRLRTALASLFNTHFSARQKVQPDEILVSAGVAAMADLLSWAICNEGDGIFVPQPLYTAFTTDFHTRNRAHMIPVPFQGLPGYRRVEDIFEEHLNIAALERAMSNTLAKGIRPRGFLLTNPHNPLGKCYPAATIRAIAAFCERHNLHFISDEIYALSVYADPEQNQTPFVSALSLDLDDCIDPRRVHVLYGTSKDFCASGLRLGVLHSRYPELHDALATVSRFAWPSYLVQDCWAKMLEDRAFLDTFITQNRQRLQVAYQQISAFLDQHDIRYLRNPVAGVFLWVDLRPYILEHPATHADALAAGTAIEELYVSGPRATFYTERVDALLQGCLARSVNIGKGANFRAEEIGWFRITFSLGESALLLGLERLRTALADFQRSPKKTQG
jgi:aspartate/methionine/tyrosine aminotransferase